MTAPCAVTKEIRIEIPLADRTGPGFYLNYGGPGAFYHYEEQEKVELLRVMPADGVFLDIGANIGLFSFYLSKLLPSIRCYAFEPLPLLASCIRKTIRQSSFRNVRLEELCIGSREEDVRLYMHKNNSGGNSILDENINTRERGESVSVRCVTLDHWVENSRLDRIDGIKIDVQGAELLVLQGARNSIIRHRPHLLIEIENRMLTSDRSWDSLMNEGLFKNYRVKVVGKIESFDVSRLNEIATHELSKGHIHTNYLFIP